MTTPVFVHVTTAADVVSPPRLDALKNTSLPEWFARESDGEIALEVREHRSQRTSTDVGGDGRQAMLREFVPSPGPGALASEIAVLFCRSCCHRSLAGLGS